MFFPGFVWFVYCGKYYIFSVLYILRVECWGGSLSEGAVSRDVWEAADRVAAYLNVLLAIDYDIDAIDRIAKARKLDDFMEGIYNALRRRQNLEESIIDALESERNEERCRILNEALGMIRGLNPSHVEKLRGLSRGDVKLVASYIGSKALAYTRTFGVLRQIFR